MELSTLSLKISQLSCVPLLQISLFFRSPTSSLSKLKSKLACSIISLLFPDSFKCHHFTVVYSQAVGLAESLYWSDCPAPMLKDSETTIRGMGCSFQATHNFMIQETIQLHQCSSFSVLSWCTEEPVVWNTEDLKQGISQAQLQA